MLMQSDEFTQRAPVLPAWLWPVQLRGAFVLGVVFPTLLVACYTGLFASNQYQSKAEFVVRGMQPEPAVAGGLGQLLGLGSPLSGAQKEAQSIKDFLLSPDAITALISKGLDPKVVFGGDGIDYFSRLRPEAPSAEKVLDYYRDHVDVSYSVDDGITRLSARAFSPGDAQRLARALLSLGEQRVNTFNVRAIESGTQLADTDLRSAESDLRLIQSELTGFRDLTRDINPTANSEVALKSTAEQDALVARERALFSDMSNYLDSSSPQMVAMRSRLRALEQEQISSRDRMTGQPKALAQRLSQYEELKLRQEFAAKRYEAARASVEGAKSQAAKQRLFIVPIIEPNLPERAYLPKPMRSTLIAFIALLAAFGIGWLIVAGIREHQA
jgi:capsular polysaccharide transport system permease protein